MSSIENKHFQYFAETERSSVLDTDVATYEPVAYDAQLLQPGDTVDGYEVGGLLGKTAASEVALATNMDTGEHVALKVPYSAESADNINHEITIHRRLGRVPFVAMLDGDGVWHERPYIATRAQEGGTLYDAIQRFRASTIQGVVDSLRYDISHHAHEIDEPVLYDTVADLGGEGLSQELARLINSNGDVNAREITDLVSEIAQEYGHDIQFRSAMANAVTMRLLEHELHLDRMKVPRDEELRKRLRIIGGAAIGVVSLHDAGFIHRDIKPANVGVDLKGAGRVIDLGIASRPDRLHPDDMVRGSLGENIPPEGYRGYAVPEGDVWALGATAFRALTNIPAISSPAESSVMEHYKRVTKGPEQSIREINGSVPSEIDEVVMASLDSDMKKRPSLEEVRDAFVKAA